MVELNRRLLEGYNHFKDEPRVQKLREDVLKYNRLVRDLGLRDHQVGEDCCFRGLCLSDLNYFRSLEHRRQVGRHSDY